MGNDSELEALQESVQAFRRAAEEAPGSGHLAALADDLGRALTAFGQKYLDFQEVCNHLYDGIHITDGEGKVLFINEAYTRTTGILPGEILGRRVQEIEGDGNFYKGSVTERVIAEGRRINSVATILKLNKEVLVTGTPVFDHLGRLKLVVTNTRDFPELKNLEKQLSTLTEERKKAHEELAYLRRQQAGGKQLFYRTGTMRAVMELIRTVAPTDVTVLITGESGTGKELVANELYQNSDRVGKPFIKVNCAAIPNELLESELFGYEDGAFTGARRSGKAGMFELANTGVLLLDEVGDMPLNLQSKLLRVLQQRELTRIGGSRPIPLDIRVVAATNQDLREAIRAGTFREDLFYRLNVVPVELKPLRERQEDISHLAEEFCAAFSKKYGKAVTLSTDGIDLLTRYPWPGNIRELENLVERIVVTSPSGVVARDQVFRALNPSGVPFWAEGDLHAGLKAQLALYEREIVLRTLDQEGSLRRAAKVLGVDHSTLAKKMKRYRVVPGEIIQQHGG